MIFYCWVQLLPRNLSRVLVITKWLIPKQTQDMLLIFAAYLSIITFHLLISITMLFREATPADIVEIVRMLTDDELGHQREDFTDPLPSSYYAAFENIQRDPNQEFMVVEDEGEVVGTLQLSFIQYLTYQGGVRAQIEAVRIKHDRRGQGLGKQLFHWAIDRARERGAHLLQLTTISNARKPSNFTKTWALPLRTKV